MISQKSIQLLLMLLSQARVSSMDEKADEKYEALKLARNELIAMLEFLKRNTNGAPKEECISEGAIGV